MLIRRLEPSDRRETFEADDSELTAFFRKYAGQNQFRHHIGVTYVALDRTDAVLGYVTVAPGQMEIDAMPPGLCKRLPAYPLPILRLARLAVAKGASGQGIGRRLLRFVLDLALDMETKLGCIGVLVDAKPVAVSFYERFGFERLEVLEGESMTRPAPVPLFLSNAEIKAATT